MLWDYQTEGDFESPFARFLNFIWRRAQYTEHETGPKWQKKNDHNSQFSTAQMSRHALLVGNLGGIVHSRCCRV